MDRSYDRPYALLNTVRPVPRTSHAKPRRGAKLFLSVVIIPRPPFGAKPHCVGLPVGPWIPKAPSTPPIGFTNVLATQPGGRMSYLKPRLTERVGRTFQRS